MPPFAPPHRRFARGLFPLGRSLFRLEPIESRRLGVAAGEQVTGGGIGRPDCLYEGCVVGAEQSDPGVETIGMPQRRLDAERRAHECGADLGDQILHPVSVRAEAAREVPIEAGGVPDGVNQFVDPIAKKLGRIADPPIRQSDHVFGETVKCPDRTHAEVDTGCGKQLVEFGIDVAGCGWVGRDHKTRRKVEVGIVNIVATDLAQAHFALRNSKAPRQYPGDLTSLEYRKHPGVDVVEKVVSNCFETICKSSGHRGSPRRVRLGPLPIPSTRHGQPGQPLPLGALRVFPQKAYAETGTGSASGEGFRFPAWISIAFLFAPGPHVASFGFTPFGAVAITPDHITVEIPDFSAMSDDEVEQHILTRVLDGRWSAQTRELIRQFGTDRLDLNDAWADSWQGWNCPCCQRLKTEIARLTAEGVLLCKIDMHHDHLTELAKAMFRAARDQDLPDEVRRQRARARSAAASLIERFTPTLICEDCNHADANMKAALGGDVDRHFSFSPGEIATFIRPEPNRSHDIDLVAGRAAWQKARPAFDDRVAFTRLIVERVNAGLHDVEAGPIAFGMNRSEATMLYNLASRAAGTRSRLGKMVDSLSARSRSTHGNQSNRGGRVRRKIVPPTADDFHGICARNAASTPWVAAGEDWRCAVCERSKFEICRKSNKGGWTAAIQYLQRFDDEIDPENQVRRSREYIGLILLGAHRRYSVCQDCRHVVTEAIKLVPGTDEYCFRPADLRGLIGEVAPHRLHGVEPEAIRDAVATNADWIAAVRDYWAHRQEAINLSCDVRIAITKGWPPMEARRLVFEAYLDCHQDADRDHGRMIWLLSEGERLSD